MQNLNEELKNLRDSPNRAVPKLRDIESILQKVAEPSYDQLPAVRSFVSRLLPECYTTFTFNTLNLQLVHEESLFFIYYALPESEMQIKAYNELLDRGFVFSKTLNMFIVLNDAKTVDNRKRTVLAFVPKEWEKLNVEVVFDAAFVGGLETTPVSI